MKRAEQEFLARVAVGPCFLLLGQAVFDDYGNDLGNGQPPGTNGLISHISELEPPARRKLFGQLASVTRQAPIPTWLYEVAKHPWNGVLTSSFDGRILRAFEAEWRRVVALTGVAGQHVPNPRSTTELKVRMLFGGVTLDDENQPPLDEFELTLKKVDVRAALTELVDGLITPRGVLAIEAYTPRDWLEPSDLFALASRLMSGQVHIFSARSELLENRYIRKAIELGTVIIHDGSLSHLLSEAGSSGRLRFRSSTVDVMTRAIRIGDGLVELPRDEWNSIIRVARPIDESATRPYAPSSPPVRYQRFRSFLGATEGAPPWTSVSSGFAFRRDFETDLRSKVQWGLSAPNVPLPIVVSGQSASGKSTALQSLAIAMAKTGEVAVLHASRRADRPQVGPIDKFAQWVEGYNDTPTLFLWDGMLDVDEYYTLHRALASRGRRVLIVGTAYIEPDSTTKGVIAPSVLSETEALRMNPWLASFGISIVNSDVAHLAGDSSFLAALYRFLPESRSSLQRGLTIELRAAEAGMEHLGRQYGYLRESQFSTMAYALYKAGLDVPLFVDGGQAAPDVDFSDRSAAGQLTSMVLVAGRRGLRIPLELVLRILSREGSRSIVDIIKRFDIIRWSEDEIGNQYLGTRTALEAELLASADLRDVRAEVAVIATLLKGLRLTGDDRWGAELQFAVDLLGRLGRESEEGRRFLPHYPRIVEALHQIRVLHGRSHYRLMLLEANFSREYAKWAADHKAMSDGERNELLAQAEHTIEEALEIVPTNSRAHLNLLVELASTLGAQAFVASGTNRASSINLRGLADRITETALKARAIDPESYYPVDVLSWVCLRLVDRAGLDEPERARLIADAIASLESIDSNQLSPKQQAMFDSRRVQFASLLNDSALAEDHLRRLAENSDPTAYYLLALRSSGLLDGQWNEEGAKRALADLMAAPYEVRSDWRCARLTLDVFWLLKTGHHFLRGERETLPFDRADWQECLQLVDLIGGASGFDVYRVQFLRGLALFHLGEYRLSLAIFDELDKSTPGVARRIIATYVASTPEGTPARFVGQVRSVTADGRRGKVWVDQLGIELTFIPHRFSMEPFERNQPLPEFRVAFNMRGPYADPLRTVRARRTPSRA